MDEKFSKTIDDAELDNVAGGFKGDVNDFESISTPEERKKVQGILSKAFGGAVEIGHYGEKENAYWYNGKAVKQDQIVSSLQKYYSMVKGK